MFCYALLSLPCYALLCLIMFCYALLSLLCYVLLCFALLCFALLGFAWLCFALLGPAEEPWLGPAEELDQLPALVAYKLVHPKSCFENIILGFPNHSPTKELSVDDLHGFCARKKVFENRSGSKGVASKAVYPLRVG